MKYRVSRAVALFRVNVEYRASSVRRNEKARVAAHYGVLFNLAELISIPSRSHRERKNGTQWRALGGRARLARRATTARLERKFLSSEAKLCKELAQKRAAGTMPRFTR